MKARLENTPRSQSCALSIVDMSEATDMEGSFSVWDNVRNEFLEDSSGDCYWTDFEDFAEWMKDEKTVKRVKSLLSVNSKN